MADVFSFPKLKNLHINSGVDICVKSSRKFATARKVLVAEATIVGRDRICRSFEPCMHTEHEPTRVSTLQNTE